MIAFSYEQCNVKSFDKLKCNPVFQSITTKLNDSEIETKSVISDNGAKCARLYQFTDEGVVVVSNYSTD